MFRFLTKLYSPLVLFGSFGVHSEAWHLRVVWIHLKHNLPNAAVAVHLGHKLLTPIIGHNAAELVHIDLLDTVDVLPTVVPTLVEGIGQTGLEHSHL
uniref:Putative secreted protein n=1 Tax=Ixodes ricinus TaxID=34613 RepID=A0A6B0UAJ7_IXORI